MTTPDFEIWQTTNQEPWVTAMCDRIIQFKTRMKRVTVKPGTPVFLHASTKLWPAHADLVHPAMRNLLDFEMDRLKSNMGHILAVGIVSDIMPIRDVPMEEWGPWETNWGGTRYCVADYAWYCTPLHVLNKPVPARGFQAPFCRAKPEVIQLAYRKNPGLKQKIVEMVAKAA